MEQREEEPEDGGAEIIPFPKPYVPSKQLVDFIKLPENTIQLTAFVLEYTELLCFPEE